MAKLKMNSESKMGKKDPCMDRPDFPDMVKQKAYELYEKSGRQAGRDLENWLEAEKIVKSKICR